MRIVDAHHHYWDPVANDHPWLRGAPIPFRYGDYAPLRRPFLPEDYDRAAAGWEVEATVTMEGEWTSDDPAGEAIWMQDLQCRTGRPAAHVAQCWLGRADLPEVLGIYAGLPIVRSVRHKPRAAAAPGGEPGGMTDPAFVAGAVRVAAAGLHFDLQTPWWHLAEAAALRDAAPDLGIVLNHTGLPSDRSAEGLAGWRAAMTRFRDLDPVFVKISGLGLPDRQWSLNDNRDIIRWTIDTFEPDRCMFASNFPVDGLCGSFDTIFSGFDAATTDYSASERDALFRSTARRCYALDRAPVRTPQAV